jgi:hypothetical protein
MPRHPEATDLIHVDEQSKPHSFFGDFHAKLQDSTASELIQLSLVRQLKPPSRVWLLALYTVYV